MSRANVESTKDNSDRHSSSSDDEHFLDECFEELLQAALEGRPWSLERYRMARPQLGAELDEIEAALRGATGPRLNPSARIGAYEIVRELGHGSMGAVYLARQTTLGSREVALKVLPPAISLSARARERFLLEARSLARIRHTHVVTVHDVIETPQLVAYAMEWIDGPALSALISAMAPRAPGAFVDDETARERLRAALGAPRGEHGWIAFVCRAGVALARALAAMHAANLVHRDVKPSNVLVRRDGTVLLSDFGLVRDEDSSMHTMTGDFVGTLGYAGPELLRGQHARVGPRTDVFALGATLYHAVCFQLPHGRGGAPEVLERVERGVIAAPRKLNRAVPRDLETVLLKALDPDPSRRYSSAAALGDELQRILDFQPISARPVGVLGRSLKRVQRDSRALTYAVAGATLALSASAAIGWSVWQRSQRGERVERAVERARLRVINHDLANRGFFGAAGTETVQVFCGVAHLGSPFAVGELSPALADYREALDEGVADESVIVEAEVFELLDGLSAIHDTDGVVVAPRRAQLLAEHRFSDGFRRTAPLAAELIPRWANACADGESRIPVPAQASDGDRRAIGLFALLINCHSGCLQAWSGLDLHARRDPLLQYFFGELRRAQDRPELALSLLLAALDACPKASRVATAACSAALECGDLPTAERVLAKLDRKAFAPTDSTLLRLEGDLQWVRGDLHEARRRYEEAFQLEGNPVAVQRIARLLELEGQFEQAWRHSAHLVATYGAWEQPRRDVQRAVDAWFRDLDEAQFEALLSAEIRVAALAPKMRISAHPRSVEDDLRALAVQRPGSSGGALFAALNASRLAHVAPAPASAPRAGAPWSTRFAGWAPPAPGARLAQEQWACLSGVLDARCGPWFELPQFLRAGLIELAVGVDRRTESSPARDSRGVLAVNAAAGRLLATLAHAVDLR